MELFSYTVVYNDGVSNNTVTNYVSGAALCSTSKKLYTLFQLQILIRLWNFEILDLLQQ
jgi:hypothetical protein